MAYHLEITERPAYLHACVTGERSPENAKRFLEDVYAACAKSGRSAVLLDMRLTGPSLPAASIFHVISRGSLDGAKLRRIAYYEARVADPGRARFAETVAVNRGVNVQLFDDLEEAQRWVAAGE